MTPERGETVWIATIRPFLRTFFAAIFGLFSSWELRFCCLSLSSIFCKVVVIYHFPNFVTLIFFYLCIISHYVVVVEWKFVASIDSSHSRNKIWLTRLSGFYDFKVEWSSSCGKIPYAVLQFILIFVSIGSLLGYFAYQCQESNIKCNLIWKNPWFARDDTLFTELYFKSLMATTVLSMLT